jgi:hypothetical protein
MPTTISATAFALEEAVGSRLAPPDPVADSGSDEGEPCDPVQHFPSDDAAFLRCRPPPSEEDEPTVFGLGATAAAGVSFALLEPRCDPVSAIGNDHGRAGTSGDCCCHHPREMWVRPKRHTHTMHGDARTSNLV